MLLALNYSSFVPTLGSAVSPPAALDGCVKAFMESLAKHTTPLKLRESHYLNTGIKWVSAPIEDPIVTDTSPLIALPVLRTPLLELACAGFRAALE